VDNLKALKAEDVPPQFREGYAKVAPDPAQWPVLVAKIAKMLPESKGFRAEEIKSIQAPTMVMLGDADIVRPEHAVEMYRLLRHGQLAVLPSSTHFVPMEPPGLGQLEDPGISPRAYAESRLKEIDMLGNKDAVANIAVKDLERARKFYEGTLGLKQVGAEGDELIAFKSGNSSLFVYRSQYAGTNKATAVTWVVGGEVEGVVRALKAKGVSFEQYDMPGMTRQGDVHVAGDMKVAWFKDPDGNILNIVSG
jgi:catechol 2,3-dioxygenase-like lactoylglutathione lyase family enzyme